MRKTSRPSFLSSTPGSTSNSIEGSSFSRTRGHPCASRRERAALVAVPATHMRVSHSWTAIDAFAEKIGSPTFRVGGCVSSRRTSPRMVPLPSASFHNGSLKRPVNPPGRALFLLRRFVSRDQAVTAGLGDQDARAGGIRFDLLAQPVDVGFQGMRGHPGVVPPDLVEQDIARDHAASGSIEILEN